MTASLIHINVEDFDEVEDEVDLDDIDRDCLAQYINDQNIPEDAFDLEEAVTRFRDRHTGLSWRDLTDEVVEQARNAVAFSITGENLSALDLSNQALPTIIEMIFADWPRPLEMLTFEITEGAAMTDTQAAVRTLGNLRQLGVKLSVDDFGTGYSSLAQMRQLPVQELKIDKSFVLRLDSTPQDQLIVKSTVDMAHGLGLSVVAEGIENEESWRLLQSWGCELAQGFFLGRPMSPEQLIDWYGTFGQRSETLADQRRRA